MIIGAYNEEGGGYVDYAKANGGVYYQLDDGLWDKLGDKAWAVNEAFLRRQLQSGVRIDYVSRDFDYVVQTAPSSGRAQEITFINRHLNDYGYVQQGHSWIKR